MAYYEFAAELFISELIGVEADSYDEAFDLAMEAAIEYDCINPEGFSIPWDNIDLNDFLIPEEG